MHLDDRGPLTEMLRRCSGASLYHRFHGFSDGAAYVQGQLRLQTDIVQLAWVGSTCVGFGVLADSGNGPWEIGLLVEDSWQLKGVGARLLQALTNEARERGIPVIEACLLGEDASLANLLRRAGPIQTQLDYGTLTVQVCISARAQS
jgi:GNAT superfamily N-acetyltransferase